MSDTPNTPQSDSATNGVSAEASSLQPVIEGKEPAGSRDASTAGLVAHIHGLRKGV